MPFATRSGREVARFLDAVAFDEAAGVRFSDKTGINIMKNYMEDGTFSRGRELISAEGSMVFVGNLDGDVQTIMRTSNLFYPMPKEMDTAFFDRIHAYLRCEVKCECFRQVDHPGLGGAVRAYVPAHPVDAVVGRHRDDRPSGLA